MASKKIPYGKTDFVEIVSKQQYYYVDKTRFIENIEQSPDYLFLIRPRRFGKSLTLNMLAAYYDVYYKNRFEELFGNLYIGKHPTGNQNKYLILKFNFSAVNSNSEKLEASFDSHCNNMFIVFLDKYEHFFEEGFRSELMAQATTADKLGYLSDKASKHNLSIYLFIDEYDNFANTILSSRMSGEERYRELTHGEGFFRYFFNVIKATTTANDAGIKKVFITGVSPLTMDDVTSGFNIGTNITIDKEFNSMVGFTLAEVTDMLNYYQSEGLIHEDINVPLAIMKTWYDNYCFSEDCVDAKVFNTDMTLYFMRTYILDGKNPRVLVDNNVKVDYGKLRHLIVLDKKLNGNFSKIKEIAENGEVSSAISSGFSIEEMRKSQNFVSLLFYFGILTIDRVEYDLPVLKVPNLAIQQMLFSYITASYNDTDIFKPNTDTLNDNMFKMAYKGDFMPWFDNMAELVQQQTSIRDYIQGEKAVQTFHLAYMSMFNYYIVSSEPELNFGYGDVLLLPNLVSFPSIKSSYIIEFKYFKQSEELNLAAATEAAKSQLLSYSQDAKINRLKGATELTAIYVIYHGWEMVACGKVE